MVWFHYTCKKEALTPCLQAVFHEKMGDEKTEEFQKRRSNFYGFKFILFVLLKALGFRHYNTMGILWYETYLFDETFADTMLDHRQYQTLLDIGAGNGSLTKNFEKQGMRISCIEPSRSFQKTLIKKGYTIKTTDDEKIYDIVTIFNVLDICADPHAILRHAFTHLAPEGKVIISLPFPIEVRSKDNINNRETNQLSQWPISFEEGVSRFYTDFLQKNWLKAIYFTRLPYIVSLPESQKTTVYDNGLFVCQKA